MGERTKEDERSSAEGTPMKYWAFVGTPVAPMAKHPGDVVSVVGADVDVALVGIQIVVAVGQ